MPLLAEELGYIALTASQPWINQNVIVYAISDILPRYRQGVQPRRISIEMGENWSSRGKGVNDRCAEGRIELCRRSERIFHRHLRRHVYDIKTAMDDVAAMLVQDTVD